jgi:hypothetical protein
MRTKSTISILTAALAFAGIQQAQAGDKEKYLVGGLLGGWILNEVFDRSSVEVHSPRPVVVERHRYPSYSHRPSGRYEYRNVKIWVPAYRERTVTRCGQVEVRWVPGHYEVRREKVWVSYERDYPESYCRTPRSRH